MKLLLVNHNYRFFGTYYRAMPMAAQLAKRGHRVTVMTVSREHRYRPTWSEVNGVRLGEMPNLNQHNSGEGYGPIDNLLRIGESLVHSYDIIHMFDHKPNATFPGLAGRLRGARLVADWADWWGGPGGINDVPKRRVPAIGKFEEWWEVKSKLWADGVVTISTVLQQRAIDLGCSPDRVLYLPTGAPLDRIHPIPPAQARQQLGVPPARRIVGFIGMGQGDLEIVMKALQQLPDVWLMVIGARNPRVLGLAQSFGLADRVWQTDFVSDAQVGLYLACADVMCLPLTDRAANRGRLPNKVLDYMAAGRPTVASPVGDIKTIVEKYGIGLLANEETFADKIRLLIADEQLRNSIGRAARQAAETAFEWSHLIDQLEAFYAHIIASE